MTGKRNVSASGNTLMQLRKLVLVPLVGLLMSLIPNSSAATADDIHSYGNPDQVRVKHVGLLLDVSFESREIGGMAFLTVERAPGAPPDAPLVLDTRGLKISGVFVGNDKALFELGKEDPIKGSSLNIKLPPGTTSVSVAYTTTKNSTALQWLDDPAACEALRVRFEAVHRELRQDTARLATDAIETVLKD